MKYKYKGSIIYVLENYDEISIKAAQLLAAQVNLKPNCVLGLATGSTPEGMYKKLIRKYEQNEVDFSEVTTFNLDEYYPIDPKNTQSYAYYMKEKFFSKINIQQSQTFIPDGQAEDVDKMCENYDLMINKYGGIDFQVLGIGNNGHIGFNEPNIRFESGTHLVELDNETIEANSRFFDNKKDVPILAISMGVRNIMHSKKIILLASGEHKAEAVEKMLFGDITPNLPASILQLHNDVTIILDNAAAKLIVPRL